MTFNEVEMLNDKELWNKTEYNTITKKMELEVEPSNDASIVQGEKEKEEHPIEGNTQELQHYSLAKDRQRG